MKRAEYLNIPYFLDHAEDIINNTNILSPEWLFYPLQHGGNFEHTVLWNRLVQKHRHESGNWYIFGRGDRWIGPNETHQEAEDRIVHDYCKATGHWDLFIWKDIKQ